MPSPVRDRMPSEVIGGRYELAELVGTGGMSSVFRAHDRLLERDVALKVLHPQYNGDGENLKQVVARCGALPVRRAVELGLAVADALAFAHGHGLVHRDVKPQNVLLTPDGEAKVTDFGIARSFEVEHGMTQTGTVLGTSNYLSPEQAGGKPTTPSTDVYSLGVVVYELLTGEVPFPGENFVAIAMKHINEPAPDVLAKRPDIPLRLAAAVD